MNKILVVEDNVDLSSSIKYMLSKSGYTVFAANDGNAGVALAKEKLPDLIIMDLMLPGISGEDAVSMIKKHPPCKDIPVIFLTALITSRGENDDIETIIVDGEKYPALAKPFDFPQLLKTVKNILHSA
jgi:DNA-binding response OmpR family regulator